MQRLTQRVDDVERNGTPEQLDKVLDKFSDAITRLCEREQAAAGTNPAEVGRGALPAPAPTRADEFKNPDSIAHLSWDEVADLMGNLNADPDAQEALTQLIDDRDAQERAQLQDRALEAEMAQWQSHEPTTAMPDISHLLHTPKRKLTPHEQAREEYDNYVYAQYAKCASELSFMVNKKGNAAGIDDFSLFSGPVSRAKKYGSEELQAWFAANGRHTLASFRHGLFGWNSDRKAANNVRIEGFENVAHTF